MVVSLLLGGNAYAGITYVCQWKKNKNDIKYQNFIYEIKNKQVYENGKLLKTSYFKINSRNLEFVINGMTKVLYLHLKYNIKLT